MIKSIPKEVYKLYNKVDLKGKVYLKLRWRLCPFEEIEKLLPKIGSILDMGCGYGMLTNLILIKSPKRFVVGIDNDKRRISIAKKTLKNRKNIKFELQDVNKAKLKDFDAVIMTDFLHHINYKKQEQFLRDVYKKLKEGGLLIIQEVNNKPMIKYWMTSFADHILNIGEKIYYKTEEEYVMLLTNIGFKVKTVPIHKDVPLSDILYVCKK